MKILDTRMARGVALLALVATVSACGLPRSGPTKREIFAGSVEKKGDAHVVAVNDYITRATSVVPALGFSKAFLKAGSIGSDTIRPGDKLSIQVWENVDNGILSSGGVPGGLQEVQVDSQGMIFIPYAGRIRAAGNTPEALRRIITEKLNAQTPDPQVVVNRIAGDGATVSIVGGVGGQGVYPIERPTRTLSAMLARAGGVMIEPEVAQITVIRGGRKGTIWFQDLFTHPEFDIALRGGDRILVQEDRRSFTALGATGAQNRIPFRTQTLSALEAIAQVGGLRSNVADPTGVFVIRDEPEEIAREVLGRNDLKGPQRIAYVLDLTKPTGMFLARDFMIRDNDTVYVTEAPYVQWNKAISALTGSLTSATTLGNAASDITN